MAMEFAEAPDQQWVSGLVVKKTTTAAPEPEPRSAFRAMS